MLTMHLSYTESANYAGAVRSEIKATARRMATLRGKRYFQIVGANGRILDVGEVCP